jgi:hypothetical protein
MKPFTEAYNTPSGFDDKTIVLRMFYPFGVEKQDSDRSCKKSLSENHHVIARRALSPTKQSAENQKLA